MRTITKFFNPLCILSIAMLWLVEAKAQTGQSLHDQSNLDYLKSISDKSTLTPSELDKVRATLLAINNEARQNSNYRRAQNCRTALNLPTNLEPLKLNDDLNKLAQEQADYQASIKKVTHDNRNFRDFGHRVDRYLKNHPKPEACAGASDLSAYPIGWMKSETHYRPTWNLNSNNSPTEPMNAVGYGVAKNGDYWYFTAIWSLVKDSETAQNNNKGNLTASSSNATAVASTPTKASASANAKVKYQGRMKPGDRLLEGEKLVSPGGKYQLRGTSQGDFVIEETQNGRIVYTFPLGNPFGDRPAVSFLSYNPDGNICIQSSNNKSYCATDGRDKVAPVILHKSDHAELTDDGRFVLVNGKGEEIWATAPGTRPNRANTSSAGAGANLALGKPARQSSDYQNFSNAGKAVDGNTSSAFKFDASNSIAHTKDELSPWWEVDLGAVHNIDRIVIWNRQDCCWERLDNCAVTISEQPIQLKSSTSYAAIPVSTPRTQNITTGPWPAGAQNRTLDNLGRRGRYVRITSNPDYSHPDKKERALNIAEVQVFGK